MLVNANHASSNWAQIYKILDMIHIHGSPLSAISTSNEQAISEM